MQNSLNKVLLCSSLFRISHTKFRFTVNKRYLAARKRFYRKAGTLQNEDNYEITLDQKKLKTPRGNLFIVKNEPLALAVEAEWNAQKDFIVPSLMHLTGLCNTVIDNPSKITKYDIVMEIISYMEADTILFHSQEDDELYELQKRQWIPVIKWFQKRFEVDIKPVRDISGPVIKQETKDVIMKYLLSFDIWALNGFKFIFEALKSIILGLACSERHIMVEKAVQLSRLEEEFQGKRWGRVEWAHELNQQDLQARVAAGVLFVYLNSSSAVMKSKTSTKAV